MKINVNKPYYFFYAFSVVCGLFLLLDQYRVKGLETFKSEFVTYIFAYVIVLLFVGVFHTLSLMFAEFEQ